MSNEKTYEGSCFCGAVQFTVPSLTNFPARFFRARSN